MKKGPFKSITSLLKLKSEDGKKPTKMAYVILIALFGLLILIVSDMFSSGETQNQQPTNLPESTSSPTEQEQETFLQKDKEPTESIMSEAEAYYEKELEKLLNSVKGVSEVDVMVNLESTEAKIYEKNKTVTQQTTEETDKNGGERTIDDSSEDSQVVLTRRGDQEVPLLVRTQKPKVRGVLVVAKGADHMQVQQWIVEAVSRSLDVPTHRISVMPKK
ncbi:stage III sporulation protein AG [Pontibacillus yanchengensis]|uniref:Stage III sporulation protein AG n=2 Tax=Pontibacillus yanchengensis TaxID=462910 RepID=A0A6I4ZTK5_9BACI|nr:stage III sporulation protein AG [Pontibacillus yanchengensis]MYL33518.1 stage III sporulation protein AG [Pontibacillus yanchengensis]MYL53568.1 stage III sporulation protein AG [Pontibacillus yanchengensis]